MWNRSKGVVKNAHMTFKCPLTVDVDWRSNFTSDSFEGYFFAKEFAFTIFEKVHIWIIETKTPRAKARGVLDSSQ